jgi:hypothetical protein
LHRWFGRLREKFLCDIIHCQLWGFDKKMQAQVPINVEENDESYIDHIANRSQSDQPSFQRYQTTTLAKMTRDVMQQMGLVGITLVVVIVAVIFPFSFFPKAVQVNRDTCSCTCFDRAMKEGYESEGYKSLYINWDREAVILTLYTSFHLLLLFQLVQKVANIILIPPFFSHIRKGVLFCVCLSLYGVIYGWWTPFNYFNDRGNRGHYHKYLGSQLILQVQELLCMLCLTMLLNKKTDDIRNRKYLLIFISTVSAFHMFVNLKEQGFLSLRVFQHKMDSLDGRTFFFFLGDLCNFILGFTYLEKSKYESWAHKVMGILVFIFLILYYPFWIA